MIAETEKSGPYKAEEMYKQGMKLVEIASQLNLPEGTVRRWKHTYKWDTDGSDKKSERSHKKPGAPKGNKNAVGHGAPKGNQNAVKHGLFSRYLPEDTREIFFSWTRRIHLIFCGTRSSWLTRRL